MNIVISTTEDGSILDAIKDGTIVISRNSQIDITIEDLKYRFLFVEPTEKGQQIVTELVDEGKETECMKLTIQVEKNELNSVFCPPVKIGNIVRDNTSAGIYVSFNARSLDGKTSHCIMFNYTFFKSR